MLLRIDEKSSFLDPVCFYDEATFHLRDKVHKRNCRIWEYDNPHVLEHERDTPKMDVWCELMKDRVIGLFFRETAVTGNVYLYIL
jgi:hypothetical protein